MISGRIYSLANERSVLDPAADPDQPFPYYLRNTVTAGHHLLAIGFLLSKLDLPPGARVIEFGPGWGNTTLELARNGLDVTAVDIRSGTAAGNVEQARDLHDSQRSTFRQLSPSSPLLAVQAQPLM